MGRAIGIDLGTTNSLVAHVDARNRVFAKHPRTRFVSLHMRWPENLDWVAAMLDRHPNVMVEFGARQRNDFVTPQRRLYRAAQLPACACDQNHTTHPRPSFSQASATALLVRFLTIALR